MCKSNALITSNKHVSKSNALIKSNKHVSKSNVLIKIVVQVWAGLEYLFVINLSPDIVFFSGRQSGPEVVEFTEEVLQTARLYMVTKTDNFEVQFF